MLSFKDELFRDRESIMSTSYYFFRQQSNYYSRGSDVNSAKVLRNGYVAICLEVHLRILCGIGPVLSRHNSQSPVHL